MSQPSRTSTLRGNNQRAALGGADGYQPMLHVDPEDLDPDYDYQWITETIAGMDERENVRTQMSTRNFTPVTVEEAPKLAPPLFPGEERKAHALIRRGAAVLMKRPKDDLVYEREVLSQVNAEAIQSVKREIDENLTNSVGHEPLPGAGVSSRDERPKTVRRGFAE